ncbi:MAG: leucine-rich repeat protein, partial [Candidatus Azobacteroides sp.]|nr:leucine-rich repeat protein [Candidatus Azobacteroides sp.]
VNWIGIQAFSGCSNLKNVEFEDGSETLTFDYYGFNHFYGSSIGSLYLGRNISCSYGSPFNDNTLLTSLTIGNQVTSIPANCFSGCTGLTDVTVKWATPLSINNDVFQNVAVSNVRLYIPRGTGTTALYQAAPVWKDFIIIGDVEAAAETQITTATISWYEVPSATSYDLAVYTDAACTQVFGTYGINASGQAQAPMRSAQRASDNRLSYTVTGLSPETPYWYTITAFENTDIIAVFTEDFVTQRTSDLTDILTNQLSIFPNPAKNDLFINSELQIKKVEIYSLTGNLLIQENNFIGKISVSGLSQGVYLFKVYTDKGVVVGKIMKE